MEGHFLFEIHFQDQQLPKRHFFSTMATGPRRNISQFMEPQSVLIGISKLHKIRLKLCNARSGRKNVEQQFGEENHGRISTVTSISLLSHSTEHFTFFSPQNPGINDFLIVLKL